MIRDEIEAALAAAFPKAVLDRGPDKGLIIVQDDDGTRYAVSTRLVLAGSVDAIIADRLGVTNEPLTTEQFAVAIGIIADPSPTERMVAQRTERMLDALFGGGMVTGRSTFPLPPGCGSQVPKAQPTIGVNEEDYRNGGLPRR